MGDESNDISAAGTITPTANKTAHYGVVLYYKYVRLASDEQGSIASFYQTTCDALGLRGRVRVAEDGINVVLAGSVAALEQHCQSIRDHPTLQGSDIDFKVSAEDSQQQQDQRATEETGFDHLTVRQCKELVTLGALAQGRADPHKNTATHLTPVEFHKELQAAQAQCESAHSNGDSSLQEPSSVTSSKEVVLLDARNAYETAIGHFKAEGVDLLDPHTRCFSDLPAWIDRHAPLLANRRILMYCTGGVRCERASAYLREKGHEFQDVAQLQGGIQRYLEAFPDGGFFKGKLLVYDHRVAVPPPSASSQLGPGPVVVGRCLVCSCPWDEYGARMRCSYCRQLVLVCDSCAQQPELSSTSPSAPRKKLLCQLCHQRGLTSSAKGHGKGVIDTSKGARDTTGQCSSPVIKSISTRNIAPSQQQAEAASGQATGGSWRLRILCLHGFRQNASSFEGRTNALRKKLRDLADFTFIDAPHTLPFFVKPKQPSSPGQEPRVEGSIQIATDVETSAVSFQQAHTAASALEQQQQAAGSQEGQGPVVRDTEVLQGGGSHPPHSSAMPESDWLAELGPPPPEKARKRAWLLSPALMEMQRQRLQEQQQEAQCGGAGETGMTGSIQGSDSCDTSQHRSTPQRQARWEVAPDWVAAQQHLSQTEGAQQAEEVLQHALSELGPFDGVLGFSQGAAMAAVLCAQQQQQQQGVAPLRFAILASGYPSPCPAHQQLAQASGPITLPSLHLFGGEEGGDAQIGPGESEALSHWFSAPICVRHGSAHIIPATRTHVSAIRSFLQQFLVPMESTS